MNMRSFGTRLALVSIMVLPLVSCQYVDQLKALRVIKDAHTFYQRGDYEGAAELYEEVLANDPSMVDAYFYLANSYDQQFRPALRGQTDNDRFLDMAIDNYITSAERQTSQQMQTLSLQYLVAAFGPDKLNDPASSEPVLQQMIKTDPSNPDNYFQLAKLYEDSGLYQEAEQVFLQVRDLRTDDSNVYQQLAGFYNRNEEFEKTIDALRERAALEPDNPEAFYIIATYYWEKAFRDFRLDDEQELEFVMLGLTEVERALELNADYIEALTYKNILLRMQANLTSDLEQQEDLIAEADELRDRAEELQKLRASGAAS
jgi:Tfp pilus assembly protein PilF